MTAVADTTTAADAGTATTAADSKPADTTAAATTATTAAAGTATTAATADSTTTTPAAAATTTQPPVTYALTLPADSPLTPADLEGVTARATALGLTPAQAQQLADVESANLTQAHAAFLEQAKADPEIGGARFEATTQKAQAGMDWLFPASSAEGQAMRDFLNRTGFGNHTAVLRAFARLGKAVAEDTPPSGSPAAGSTTRTAEEVLYGKSPA